MFDPLKSCLFLMACLKVKVYYLLNDLYLAFVEQQLFIMIEIFFATVAADEEGTVVTDR
jgi:hypothetical protein